MKRHGFHGVSSSHGAHKNHRKPGSIGGCATPGRVFKGMRMAGRMGGERQTTQNLTIHAVDAERGLLLDQGRRSRPPRRHRPASRTAAEGSLTPCRRLTSTARRAAKAGTVELPAEIFDVQTNVPLIHQVVVAQLAAARQGTHSHQDPRRGPRRWRASRTARRAPAAPVRARPARRSSPAVASSTARSRATTPSAPPRR